VSEKLMVNLFQAFASDLWRQVSRHV